MGARGETPILCAKVVSASPFAASLVSRFSLLRSTIPALYKCAKVNIFRNPDLEKMFGHKQPHALARLDTGWFWNNYRKPQRGFSASKLRKDKGLHELYGTGKDHHPLAIVFATVGARSDCPRLCGRNRFSRLDPR